MSWNDLLEGLKFVFKALGMTMKFIGDQPLLLAFFIASALLTLINIAKNRK